MKKQSDKLIKERNIVFLIVLIVVVEILTFIKVIPKNKEFHKKSDAKRYTAQNRDDAKSYTATSQRNLQKRRRGKNNASNV